MTFLSLSKALTIGGAFFVFAAITVVAWLFVFFLLPETRGRNLEDTEKLFGDLNWKKKFWKLKPVARSRFGCQMATSQIQSGPIQHSNPLDFSSAVVGESLAKLSFVSASSKPVLQPRFQPIPLTSRQYGQVDGKPAVYFSAAEFDAGVALFRYSLVAKFSVGRPPIAEIREVFKGNWPIKGRATISDIWDGRHLMIILDSKDDARIALTSLIRKVGHAMFRLFRYTPDYNPRRESTTTTKWVRLPGLHPGFFSRNYVAEIVNYFGNFLDLDTRTKACALLKYARACVEVDVSKKIPEEVNIVLSDGRKFRQRIEVEVNLSYCAHCKIHGHTLMDCRKKKKVNNDSKIQSPQIVQSVDKGKVVVTNKISITIQSVDLHEGWTEVKKRQNKRDVKVKKDVTGNQKFVPTGNVATSQQSGKS
ncbi:hypothetical protein QQ045_029621 [Rhodiola kirilowii]